MSLSTSSKRPLNTSRDGDSTTSLGSLFQCLITLSVKKNFLISSLNLPWRNLRPFPLVLSLVTWEKRPTPTSLQPPFHVVVESDEVSPQPPFLQAKQSQLPQPLLIRLLLQTLHQLRCPSLDTLQHLNVPLVVGGPKLNTVFEVWPHQCRVQGHNHFPSPAGHAIFDTGQDAIGLLGRLGTLLAHIQAAVNQHPQVLLCQAAFQPLFPKPVALHGVAVAQVQDLALGLVKPHTIHPSPSIQPVQVPLQSLPTLQQINTPTQLGVVCKLTESTLDPFVQIIDKDNHLGWKRTLTSSSPTVNLALPSPPLNHVLKHHIYTSFKYLQGWRLNHFPGQLVPMLDNPFGEEIFPNIQSKPPLVQLEAISSRPITCYLGEETNAHLATASFQAVVESNKVSPQPPLLQAKQSQLPQPLLIRLCSRPFTTFVALLWTASSTSISLLGPKLNTVFEVRPHQCRVQGHDHFPSAAGHTISDTSQDAIGLLGHLGTLLAHIQLAVDQHAQVLFLQAAFQPLFPKPVALHGAGVT
ncbi:LOW QUALITY PROTEIN: hypothetical protein QYF61_005276 [Mycteria americana]|uniref:Uncharacterized protein n=1 Tax=Mycteria americana TaxID=33587 RepID=A0AAN7NHQ7_MYCAM|nr:LOW QUALITY PROTEIN: hypothetical protein QYF61_005276 [Mycteria americana]